jgi:hypothetical protein
MAMALNGRHAGIIMSKPQMTSRPTANRIDTIAI